MKKIQLLIISILVLVGYQSCKEDVLPKPKAQLRLEYNEPQYVLMETECPYTFEKSIISKAKINNRCWINLEYPELRASINMTYRPIQNNLNELLQEAEKLTFNHSIKADGISSRPYLNEDHKVYGSIFEVSGNAASPLQFHVTDSSRHFITGAVYFDVQPNYDSIRPAVQYIENDIVRMIESLQWKYN